MDSIDSALTPDVSVSGWDRSLYAFLAEKQQRSGSMRTVNAYAGMLRDFFGRAGKTPDAVGPQEAFAWAYGVGLSGKQPSPTTINARIACLSSYFRFLARMELVKSNPCDRLERPRPRQASARGLSAEQVRRLLVFIPESSVGLRDRAIILTLVLTGRRRAEVLALKAGDIQQEDERIVYSYRGKGGKAGQRELPRPAFDAIRAWLNSVGRELPGMAPEESLWPATGRTRGITTGLFYMNLRRYLATAGLPESGVHLLRHAAAKLRREAGQSIEEVSRFLDHSSLAVTSTYLRRIEVTEDSGWLSVAESIGLGQSSSGL
jgi:integrase/recombinase XerC